MAVRTANRSRSPRVGPTDLGAIVRATVDALPTCACGQALDTCHTRCCPRCGVRVATLGRATSVPRHSPERAA